MEIQVDGDAIERHRKQKDEVLVYTTAWIDLENVL